MYSSSSSESSDSENIYPKELKSLDFSYQILDTESANFHLKNSVVEQHSHLRAITFQSHESTIDLDDSHVQNDENTERLYLQNNVLLTIPIEIMLFSKIRLLDLSNNNLSHIDDFILNISTLQNLYLKNNALQDDSLPKDMSSLTQLREINISGNSFTRLPEHFYTIKSLRYLYAGNNQINEIPQGIKVLKK